jgi:hypothetical protein
MKLSLEGLRFEIHKRSGRVRLEEFTALFLFILVHTSLHIYVHKNECHCNHPSWPYALGGGEPSQAIECWKFGDVRRCSHFSTGTD